MGFKGLSLPAGYRKFLEDVKARIKTARIKAVLAANSELIQLYWDIGGAIVERQRSAGWGKAVVERLAQDLQRSFPGVKGFSRQNVWYMRSFFIAWTEPASILQRLVGELDGRNPPRVVGELPWGQNLSLISKIESPAVRLWYATQAMEHGWTRPVLIHHIESGLYERQGKATTNFKTTLPPPQSHLAEQVIKDPYALDFLKLAADAHEKELERGLVEHVRKFLLELGVGFAFVGQQVHLEVGGDDFYIDLLFYHLRLRCFVVIELKNGAFKPEHAGKMSFYLSAVDDLMRHPDDKSSLGIILCRSKNKLVAEYALRDSRKPISVSAFNLTKALPEELKGTLPTVGELEEELGPG